MKTCKWKNSKSKIIPNHRTTHSIPIRHPSVVWVPLLYPLIQRVPLSIIEKMELFIFIRKNWGVSWFGFLFSHHYENQSNEQRAKTNESTSIKVAYRITTTARKGQNIECHNRPHDHYQKTNPSQCIIRFFGFWNFDISRMISRTHKININRKAIKFEPVWFDITLCILWRMQWACSGSLLTLAMRTTHSKPLRTTILFAWVFG